LEDTALLRIYNLYFLKGMLEYLIKRFKFMGFMSLEIFTFLCRVLTGRSSLITEIEKRACYRIMCVVMWR
jgi:hypothetical protein